MRRVLAQAGLDQTVQFRRDLRPKRARGTRRLVQDLEHQGLRPVLLERPAARRHLVEDHAERVNVGAGIPLLAAHLLGRHVGERAEDRPGPRQVGGGVGRVQEPGQAEIEDLRHPGRRQHDVSGFQVAMQEAQTVRGLECVTDLRAETHQLVQPHGTLPQSRLERASRDVFHDEEVQAVLRVEVEDGRNAGVREAGQDVRLAAESVPRGGVRKRAAQEYLDRDVAVEVQIVRAVHLAHAALAERLENAVMGKGGSDHCAEDTPKHQGPRLFSGARRSADSRS